MDVMKTPGAFSWSELMTTDAKAATEFYGSLFGWKFETMDMGQGPYHVVKVEGAPQGIGGIMQWPADAGAMPPAWGCYVTVADVDATVKQATQLGGKLLMGPMDVPTVGRMATLQDPQGAAINVITYVADPA